jgi:hypothetical protein
MKATASEKYADQQKVYNAVGEVFSTMPGRDIIAVFLHTVRQARVNLTV